jgi:hypothetical protein
MEKQVAKASDGATKLSFRRTIGNLPAALPASKKSSNRPA